MRPEPDKLLLATTVLMVLMIAALWLKCQAAALIMAVLATLCAYGAVVALGVEVWRRLS
jgi:hypothetical protein